MCLGWNILKLFSRAEQHEMGHESGGVTALFSDHTTATADVASSMSAMMKLLLRIDAGAAFM